MLENKQEIINDYRLACFSRQLSLLGRKEVLQGRAKFGIFGDGMEVAQIAFAKTFRDGDWRSGYYRDQTLMLATGQLTPLQFFAQLYGETRKELNPHSGGRLMNNHTGNRILDENGDWKNQMVQFNAVSDISPTAGQMPRLLGLAYASKLYREMPDLPNTKKFTVHGNEVAFGTIGDASIAEGHFWETINAATVLQVPMALAVWDNGWGISVPKDKQFPKDSLSELLKGFEPKGNQKGLKVLSAKGWDYPGLIKAFLEGVKLCREEHIPVLFHIDELTQPTGHSSSGSHERYKAQERLDWEKEFDALKKMREWMLTNAIADEAVLLEIESQTKKEAKKARNTAWKSFQAPLLQERDAFLNIIENKTCKCSLSKNQKKIDQLLGNLKALPNPVRKDIHSSAKKALRFICNKCFVGPNLKSDLEQWLHNAKLRSAESYNSRLYSNTPNGVLKIKSAAPQYTPSSRMLNGREILNLNFDALFTKHPKLVVLGEDVGKLGDVNMTLDGLQKKYGELRVTDTGIREATIIGQSIGLAMRGFRPIVEIQYFDYILYGLQTLSDDVATLRYRTCGGQAAPIIVRTRGHRLEGIWHSGSPMSMVVNSLRGMCICVPRNMVQAAGMYNSLLQSDDPALIIEPLNAYRLKEKMPNNPGEFKIPLGQPEIVTNGKDVTIVTYGSCVRIALDAVKQLLEFDIHCEVIDIQTLLPFDRGHVIAASIKKTNKVLFFDEDVPSGATAFMLQKVIEEQGAYKYLDMPPKTLTAHEHRPAYGTDGDYFSNPNAEDVFETVYGIMNGYNPTKYPDIVG